MTAAVAGSIFHKPILVIGSSHTTAIAAALSPEEKLCIEVVNVADFFGADRRNKSLPDNLGMLYAPRRIFCCFGGSEHNILGLMEAPTRIDFHSPSIPGVDATRWIVPRAVVKATLQWRMQKWLNMATILTKTFKVPIAHLCSPPPFRTVDKPAQLPRAFHDQLHLGIAPAVLRLKLYELHTEIASEHMAMVGIDFVHPPSASIDADGYLKSDFWSKDPTHGDARYGSLVLKKIKEIAS